MIGNVNNEDSARRYDDIDMVKEAMITRIPSPPASPSAQKSFWILVI